MRASRSRIKEASLRLDFVGDASSEPNALAFSPNDRPWSVFGECAISDRDASYTHVSLFAGCGGFDLGFRQAGFRTVFANDINSDACATYRHNLGAIAEGDIRDLAIPALATGTDVLTGGFPCQPFSNAGSRKGTGDSRGTLFETAIDAVAKLKPKVVLFENVRGLLSFRSGQRLLVEEICHRLETLGYDVAFSLIDASMHHVAQKRLRLFIVGTSKTGVRGTFAFPTPVPRKDLSLADTILDLSDSVQNQLELMRLNPQAVRLGKLVPEGGSWKDISDTHLPARLLRIRQNMARYRWPNFYRRFHRNEIAGTITAAFKPENAGVWHPTEPRIFSVREVARIQSFPDWFEFPGENVKAKYQQIGNAVPPRLAYELAIQIRRVLDGDDLRLSRPGMRFTEFAAQGKPLRACDRDIVYSVK